MITLEFSAEEKQALYYERFHHPHPRVQLKIEAVWLKSQDLPQSANLSKAREYLAILYGDIFKIIKQEE